MEPKIGRGRVLFFSILYGPPKGTHFGPFLDAILDPFWDRFGNFFLFWCIIFVIYCSPLCFLLSYFISGYAMLYVVFCYSMSCCVICFAEIMLCYLIWYDLILSYLVWCVSRNMWYVMSCYMLCYILYYLIVPVWNLSLFKSPRFSSLGRTVCVVLSFVLPCYVRWHVL